jgi:hypothetical protein
MVKPTSSVFTTSSSQSGATREDKDSRYGGTDIGFLPPIEEETEQQLEEELDPAEEKAQKEGQVAEGPRQDSHKKTTASAKDDDDEEKENSAVRKVTEAAFTAIAMIANFVANLLGFRQKLQKSKQGERDQRGLDAEEGLDGPSPEEIAKKQVSQLFAAFRKAIGIKDGDAPELETELPTALGSIESPDATREEQAKAGMGILAREAKAHAEGRSEEGAMTRRSPGLAMPQGAFNALRHSLGLDPEDMEGFANAMVTYCRVTHIKKPDGTTIEITEWRLESPSARQAMGEPEQAPRTSPRVEEVFEEEGDKEAPPLAIEDISVDGDARALAAEVAPELRASLGDIGKLSEAARGEAAHGTTQTLRAGPGLVDTGRGG